LGSVIYENKCNAKKIFEGKTNQEIYRFNQKEIREKAAVGPFRGASVGPSVKKNGNGGQDEKGRGH